MVHRDQTYCIPNRSIFDNLFLVHDIITTAAYQKLNLGLLSLDQEKAFDRVDTYQRAASAKVNWKKCSSLLIGDWQDSTPPVLPQRCAWNLEGLKFLGVYLGTFGYMNKNWEGVEEKIAGRLQRWRWILPQLCIEGGCWWSITWRHRCCGTGRSYLTPLSPSSAVSKRLL